LFAAFASSLPIAFYILGCAVIGIVATALLTDYTNKDISEEYDKVGTVLDEVDMIYRRVRT
jgi:hypothetical protein